MPHGSRALAIVDLSALIRYCNIKQSCWQRDHVRALLQQKYDRACRDNGGTSGSVLNSYIAKLSARSSIQEHVHYLSDTYR